MKKFTVLLFLMAGTVVGTTLDADTVLAHAEVVRTEPAHKEVVKEELEWIAIHFNEPVKPATDIRLIAEGFSTVLEIAPNISDEMLLVRVKDLAGFESGNWTVHWSAQSVDGDIVSGTFKFEYAHQEPLKMSFAVRLLGFAVVLVVSISGWWHFNKKGKSV